MSSDIALSLRSVNVSYGATAAVVDVDLDVPDGAIMALLGPSGCGKSTLLRAIAGLEPLQSGGVSWHGADMASVPVHRRSFGLMFQDHALFPHRNVADNVGFGLRMAGVGRAERGQRVADLLELVGLAGMGERTVGTLSGGEAQRVALARAVAPEPALLLLDEPLGSLDRALRDRLVHEIRGVVTELGLTAIHVTHDHDEAMSIADHIALMAEGTIRRVGTVHDLLVDPGDSETANALGIETVWAIDAADPTATPFGRTRPLGDDVTALLIRPDNVVIADGDGVPATIVRSRHRGGSWLLTCRLSDDREIVASNSRRLNDGVEVNLVVDHESISALRRAKQ